MVSVEAPGASRASRARGMSHWISVLLYYTHVTKSHANCVFNDYQHLRIIRVGVIVILILRKILVLIKVLKTIRQALTVLFHITLTTTTPQLFAAPRSGLNHHFWKDRCGAGVEFWQKPQNHKTAPIFSSQKR